VKFVAPTALFIILAWSVMEDLTRPYEGYPANALLLIGAGWMLAIFLASGMFSVYTKHRDGDLMPRE